MKKPWKNILTVLLAVMLLYPQGAFASVTEGNESASSSQEDDPGQGSPSSPSGMATVDFQSESYVNIPADGDISAGESENYTISMSNTAYRLSKIQIDVKPTTEQGGSATLETQTLSADKLSVSFEDRLSASVSTWPTDDGDCTLTLNAAGLNKNVDVTVTFKTEPRTAYRASIPDVSHAVTTATNSSGNYYDGDTVTLTIDPEDGYALSELVLNYGSQSQRVTGSTTWQDWTVSWSSSGETKITGTIHDDLEVRATVEELPDTYSVWFDLDTGLELERPGSSSITVEEGDSLYVRVSIRDGYTIGDLTVQYGRSYASWASGQTYLVMGNDRVRVTEEEDEVSFTLPAIYDDTELRFTAGYDEDHIPIEIDEGSRINIDTDCDDTVERGTDAVFYISTTSDRYSVRRITLQIGDEEATAEPDDGEIRVGRRNYQIEDLGGGEYALYVDNITEPVTVSATSTSVSTVSRPTLTIRSSSHLDITKSVSSNRIDAGDDVNFYFEPDDNYQIDEITVRIGSSSRTEDASSTSIRVGGQTYSMRRSSSGTVTLYLTNIEQNVTVSATTYYSRDTVDSTGEMWLNTSARNAFMSGYPDGTFRPGSYMTRAEAVVMLHNLAGGSVGNVPANSAYWDVPSNAWYARAVNEFEASGILDAGTYFYPNQYITRGDFVEILYRLSGSPSVPSYGAQFNDINGTPNRDAIRYAASRGWVSGYPDGTFRPYSNIMRSEAATLMTHVLGRTTGGSTIYYTDVPATHWAYRYIQLASSYV